MGDRLGTPGAVDLFQGLFLLSEIGRRPFFFDTGGKFSGAVVSMWKCCSFRSVDI